MSFFDDECKFFENLVKSEYKDYRILDDALAKGFDINTVDEDCEPFIWDFIAIGYTDYCPRDDEWEDY